MATDGDRVIPGRLAFGVFATVLALILIVIAAQQIPHAKRPRILQPTVITTTITATAPAT